MKIEFNKKLFRDDIAKNREKLIKDHGFNRNLLDQYIHNLASPKTVTLVQIMNALGRFDMNFYFLLEQESAGIGLPIPPKHG